MTTNNSNHALEAIVQQLNEHVTTPQSRNVVVTGDFYLLPGDRRPESDAQLDSPFQHLSGDFLIIQSKEKDTILYASAPGYNEVGVLDHSSAAPWMAAGEYLTRYSSPLNASVWMRVTDVRMQPIRKPTVYVPAGSPLNEFERI